MTQSQPLFTHLPPSLPVMFPMDILEKGLGANNFGMLGLGDIVIPGRFPSPPIPIYLPYLLPQDYSLLSCVGLIRGEPKRYSVLFPDSSFPQSPPQGDQGVFLLWVPGLCPWSGHHHRCHAHVQGCPACPALFSALLPGSSTVHGSYSWRHLRHVQVRASTHEVTPHSPSFLPRYRDYPEKKEAKESKED